MSIIVKALTKIYGQQKAVNAIEFVANKGEIVGFLGPNGAGKTTTMKMLTGFLAPTSGTATVCGYDIKEEPMKIREVIGYLPEHNPLYLDLYVKESLLLTARLHHLGKATKTRIDEIIELTGLQVEQHKKLRQLSKGYRQRVGLAQAMIHDPKVLILDEPTSGLDPNQILEIRQVIKALGKEKTVVLSTHIMQEVQALCDRVVIINKGNIVADDQTSALQQYSQNQHRITLEFANTAITADELRTIDSEAITQVTPIEDGKWLIEVNGEVDIRPKIFNFAVQNQYTLLTLFQEQHSLEEVFRELTS